MVRLEARCPQEKGWKKSSLVKESLFTWGLGCKGGPLTNKNRKRENPMVLQECIGNHDVIWKVHLHK